MNGIEDRARSLFLAAVDRASADWPAYLDEVCGDDDALRGRVEKLLSAHAAMGSIDGGAAADPLTERPGTVIGPYRLMEEIGEGGMGRVFVAEQAHPVRRRVALKVVKPGMDTRQVLARFEAERQALAMMDHPHIAKVFDGGTTPAGRPYFVMELVKGVPVTAYCDDNHLTVRERLGLFADVCAAVQHAHQKGVIHRDLKPANVLVTSHDGTPVAKVIDFGVAKAVGMRLTDLTVYTQFTQLIGTPLYMSPEQAGQSGLDVDTRTDIYALGVLLYELLTGRTPFDGERLRTAGLDEFRRIIREEEPARPSTRISTLGMGGETVSANRRVEPRELRRLVRGELDWIVMKALEKDRTRRYETAAAFAADVRRYLADEPVQAGRPSRAYRVRKFVRRNRGTVLAAGLVLLALAGGLGGTTWGLVRAEEQRARAEANERTAVAAAAAEKVAKETAEEREAEARAALEFVETRLIAPARPRGQAGGKGPDVTLRQALDAAVPFVAGSFGGQPLVEARLRNTLGISFAHLGEAKAAEEQFAAALKLYTARLGPDDPLTLSCRHNLANAYRALGRPDESLDLHREVLAERQAVLGDHHADTIKSLVGVANALHALKRHDEALEQRRRVLRQSEERYGPTHRDTLQAAGNLANTLMELGQNERARELYERTLNAYRTEHPNHPDALTVMSNLAVCLGKLGDRKKERELNEEALRLRAAAFGEDHVDTLGSMLNLSTSFAQAGEFEKALEYGQRALRLLRVKPGPDHPTTLLCLGNVAAFLCDLGRGDEAVPLIDECLKRAAGKPVAQTLTPELLMRRLRVFETKKDATGCRATAEMWEAVAGRTRPDTLVLSARMRAVTATACARDPALAEAERTRQAEAEAGQAEGWLKQAVARGHRDVKYLEGEADFAVLRDRPAFKSLVAELKKARQ